MIGGGTGGARERREEGAAINIKIESNQKTELFPQSRSYIKIKKMNLKKCRFIFISKEPAVTRLTIIIYFFEYFSCQLQTK